MMSSWREAAKRIRRSIHLYRAAKSVLSQMWTFCLITQRDIFFVTDHIEDQLLLDIVAPITKSVKDDKQ